MAGFNDIAQALQFGAGLVHGFQQQTEAIRAQHDKQQLELLKLLSSDETKNVTPIDQSDVVGDQGFFGGGTLKTKEGHPAFKVGGNIFAVKPRPMLGGDETEAAQSGVPAPTAAPQPKALAPLNQYGPIPEAPTPAAPGLPQGPPAQETTAPGLTLPSAQKSVAGAKKSYAALAPEMKQRIHAAVQAEIAKHPNVSFEEALGLIGVESQFNPQAQNPDSGASGLMQLMPDTAKMLNVKDSFNVEENVRGGIEYYSRLKEKYNGDQTKALAAYNAGPGRVDKLGRVPNIPETQAYVQAVPAAAAAFRPNIQPGTQASVGKTIAPEQQAAAQPDTSMMVAGPGAPAPKETELPPADTLAARQQAAEAAATKRYKGAQTRAEMKEYRTAVKEARDKAETHYGQELREVEKDVTELRKRTHDPRILDMLDEVKTYNQFEHVKAVIKATPEQDFRGQAVDQLKRAVAAGRGDEAAVEVWKNMKRANYSDAEIKEAMNISGYDDAKDVAKAKKKAEAQKKLDIEAAPQKIAAERPEILKTKEAEAGIITPQPEDMAQVNLEMQTDIKRGKVPKDITMSDYLKQYPGVLTSIQAERKAAKPETDVDKLLNTVQRLEAKTGRTPAEEEALRAAQGEMANKGLSPEEVTQRAVEKKQALDEAAANAKSDRIRTAQQDVNKILTGETPPPAGMTKYDAALQRLAQDHMKPSDIGGEFEKEFNEAKPFKKLEDRQGWVTSNYGLPAVESVADAKDKGAIQLAKEERPRFALGNELHVKLQRIDDNMKKLAEIDPRWKQLSEQQGLPNRIKLNYYQQLVKVTQDNPATAAFMRAIDNDMKEIGINYGRFITGMQGRPAQKLIELSTQNLPNADTSVVGWLTGKGKLPDNPATMLTQLGLMKDMIRTVQDDVLMEHGAITPQEQSKRAAKRLDDLAHPERAKASAATQTAPAAATPAPVAPAAPAAPAAPKTKGEEEADAYLNPKGGKP
jgi:hypothetical protein